MTAQQPRLGILGGMGPQATQVFYQRILDKTDARRDQEHLPTLIWSDTGMPDRTQAILSGQTEPVYQRLLADGAWAPRAGPLTVPLQPPSRQNTNGHPTLHLGAVLGAVDTGTVKTVNAKDHCNFRIF